MAQCGPINSSLVLVKYSKMMVTFSEEKKLQFAGKCSERKVLFEEVSVKVEDTIGRNGVAIKRNQANQRGIACPKSIMARTIVRMTYASFYIV